MFPLLFKGINVPKLHYGVCELVKHHRVSFPISNKRVSISFVLVHSYIWGLATILNFSSSRWFVWFIDDCTWVTWVFLLKQKTDVSIVFPNFHKMVKAHFRVGIKKFRSNNAKDYFNQVLSPHFKKEVIIHKSSCASTPQQKRVVERKNGHLLTITRTFLFKKNVPILYWGEAVLTNAHLINRLPSKVLGFKNPMDFFSKYFLNFTTSRSCSKGFLLSFFCPCPRS